MKFILEESLNETNTRPLVETPHFDEVYIRNQDVITVDIAKRFLQIRSVSTLSLWCGVTRAAMKQFISLPKLKELVVFELKKSGRLSGFEQAGLTSFACVFDGLSETDLLEIVKCQSLEKLGAQNSKVTERVLDSVLALPALTEIDFECSNFNNEHARIIAKSKRITKLEIGATRISKAGLKHICSMKQLKALDIWSNKIDENDLDLLSGLPNLEYLSIGGHDEQTTFKPETTIPKLEKIPSLKRIWLDGLRLSEEERAYLNDRYETVRC